MWRSKTLWLSILAVFAVLALFVYTLSISNPCLRRLKKVAVALSEIWNDPNLAAQIKTLEDYQRVLKERIAVPLACPDTGAPYRFFPKEGIVLADTQLHGFRKVWLAIEWKHKKQGEHFRVISLSPTAEAPKPKPMPSFFKTLFKFIWSLASWFNPTFQPFPEDCPTNLKNANMALLMYIQDWDERFPPMKDVALIRMVLSPYVRNMDTFFCPTSKQPYSPNPNLHRKSLIDIHFPFETPSFYELTIHPDGLRGVAYVDGHVKFVNQSQWQALKRRYQLPLPP